MEQSFSDSKYWPHWESWQFNIEVRSVSRAPPSLVVKFFSQIDDVQYSGYPTGRGLFSLLQRLASPGFVELPDETDLKWLYLGMAKLKMFQEGITGHYTLDSPCMLNTGLAAPSFLSASSCSRPSDTRGPGEDLTRKLLMLTPPVSSISRRDPSLSVSRDTSPFIIFTNQPHLSASRRGLRVLLLTSRLSLEAGDDERCLRRLSNSDGPNLRSQTWQSPVLSSHVSW